MTSIEDVREMGLSSRHVRSSAAPPSSVAPPLGHPSRSPEVDRSGCVGRDACRRLACRPQRRASVGTGRTGCERDRIADLESCINHYAEAADCRIALASGGWRAVRRPDRNNSRGPVRDRRGRRGIRARGIGRRRRVPASDRSYTRPAHRNTGVRNRPAGGTFLGACDGSHSRHRALHLRDRAWTRGDVVERRSRNPRARGRAGHRSRGPVHLVASSPNGVIGRGPRGRDQRRLRGS